MFTIERAAHRECGSDGDSCEMHVAFVFRLFAILRFNAPSLQSTRGSLDRRQYEWERSRVEPVSQSWSNAEPERSYLYADGCYRSNETRLNQ